VKEIEVFQITDYIALPDVKKCANRSLFQEMTAKAGELPSALPRK
jgi:hypothetical protein